MKSNSISTIHMTLIYDMVLVETMASIIDSVTVFLFVYVKKFLLKIVIIIINDDDNVSAVSTTWVTASMSWAECLTIISNDQMSNVECLMFNV